MNKFLTISLGVLLLLNSILIVVYLQKNYFPKESYGPRVKNPCGYWSVMGGGSLPTCECDGQIVKKGGPSGPSDDGGGSFVCEGEVIRSW